MTTSRLSQIKDQLSNQGWFIDVTNGVVTIESQSRHSGIVIVLNKKRKQMYVSGFYDSVAGIQGGILDLAILQELMGPMKQPPICKSTMCSNYGERHAGGCTP